MTDTHSERPRRTSGGGILKWVFIFLLLAAIAFGVLYAFRETLGITFPWEESRAEEEEGATDDPRQEEPDNANVNGESADGDDDDNAARADAGGDAENAGDDERRPRRARRDRSGDTVTDDLGGGTAEVSLDRLSGVMVPTTCYVSFDERDEPNFTDEELMLLRMAVLVGECEEGLDHVVRGTQVRLRGPDTDRTVQIRYRVTPRSSN